MTRNFLALLLVTLPISLFGFNSRIILLPTNALNKNAPFTVITYAESVLVENGSGMLEIYIYPRNFNPLSKNSAILKSISLDKRKTKQKSSIQFVKISKTGQKPIFYDIDIQGSETGQSIILEFKKSKFSQTVYRYSINPANVETAKAKHLYSSENKEGLLTSLIQTIELADKNNDNELDKEEIFTAPKLVRIFEQIDTDKTGTISMDEIKKHFDLTNTTPIIKETLEIAAYKKKINDSISKKWHEYRKTKETAEIGSLKVSFEVTPKAELKNLTILKDEADGSVKEFSLKAIRDADLPKMPETVKVRLKGSNLKMDYNIVIY